MRIERLRLAEQRDRFVDLGLQLGRQLAVGLERQPIERRGDAVEQDLSARHQHGRIALGRRRNRRQGLLRFVVAIRAGENFGFQEQCRDLLLGRQTLCRRARRRVAAGPARSRACGSSV